MTEGFTAVFRSSIVAKVGAAPESESSSACMPVFWICNADEDSIFNFVVALQKSKRTWNVFENGAILFIQSFSWMIDCGLASVYLENIQKLRACVIRHLAWTSPQDSVSSRMSQLSYLFWSGTRSRPESFGIHGINRNDQRYKFVS